MDPRVQTDGWLESNLVATDHCSVQLHNKAITAGQSASMIYVIEQCMVIALTEYSVE